MAYETESRDTIGRVIGVVVHPARDRRQRGGHRRRVRTDDAAFVGEPRVCHALAEVTDVVEEPGPKTLLLEGQLGG